MHGCALSDQITETMASALSLAFTTIILGVILPAVWSRNQDRRRAARTILRDMLQAITKHQTKEL